MIFKGSRYEPLAGATFTVVTETGEHRALPPRRTPRSPATYRHTLVQGERLDHLADRFYGDAQRFWLIADANGAMDPEELLEPGRVILIPPDRAA